MDCREDNANTSVFLIVCSLAARGGIDIPGVLWAIRTEPRKMHYVRLDGNTPGTEIKNRMPFHANPISLQIIATQEFGYAMDIRLCGSGMFQLHGDDPEVRSAHVFERVWRDCRSPERRAWL